MSTPVLFGPIGRAVRKIAPFLEADPLGVYVAALSFWSAAIGGTSQGVIPWKRPSGAAVVRTGCRDGQGQRNCTPCRSSRPGQGIGSFPGHTHHVRNHFRGKHGQPSVGAAGSDSRDRARAGRADSGGRRRVVGSASQGEAGCIVHDQAADRMGRCDAAEHHQG